MSSEDVLGIQQTERQWFNRLPIPTQVAIVAALLVPTFVLFGAWFTVGAAITWVGVVALYGIYFGGALVLVAKGKLRRNWALVVAAVTLAVDLAQTWYATSPETDEMTLSSFILFRWWLTVGYVAAWGIARRVDPKWIIGLPLTALAAIGLIFPLEWSPIDTTALLRWAVWIGGFVIGCLICWALDAHARGVFGQQMNSPKAS